MSLLTVYDSFVNDPSSRRLLLFGENLADDGGLFRGEVRHINRENLGTSCVINKERNGCE